MVKGGFVGVIDDEIVRDRCNESYGWCVGEGFEALCQPRFGISVLHKRVDDPAVTCP